MDQIVQTETQLRADLLQRAHALGPILKANANRADAECRIPQENLDGLRDSELLALARPKKFGGLETSLRTLLEVQMAVAEHCGSTSWVAGLGNVGCFLISLFPFEAQDEVWGGNIHARAVVVGGSAEASATEVPGGWKVSGKWRYASGSLHADWAILGVPFTGENGAPDVKLVMLPMKDASVELSWDVTGLCGTGSNTVVVNDVFVPWYRQISFGAAMAGHASSPYDAELHPLYRTPFSAVFNLCIAASPVGLAKAAVRLAVETTPKQILPYINIPQAAAPTIQHLIATAAYTADSAELHLIRAADAADAAAALGAGQTPLEVARTDADRVAVARYAIEAVRLIIRAKMSSSHGRANPLQRIWRDCETAVSHFAFAEMHVENYGKVLLGQPTGLGK